ncbi:MAG: methyltransferase, partial [Bacteroidia bacterium]|nr:methyltransferase [Bacteroidia bacterium]
MWYTLLLERNLLPDAAIRFGIRRLLRQRLAEEDKGNPEARQEHLMNLIEKLKSSPIAINTGDANEQHYEVPSDFFSLVLGKYMKYSSGYWDKAIDELDSAERRMLELTCERAEIKDGQKILELGCGWGSLSLFMAERYPNSRITAVSNSHSQKLFIEGSAQGRKINNLTVITADMNDFETDGR